MENKSCGCSLPADLLSSPKCDAAPLPAVKKLLMRTDEHGQVQVQVNGEGPWLGATYYPDEKIVRFSYPMTEDAFKS